MEKSDYFIETMEKEIDSLEVTDIVSRYVSDVLGKILFGLDLKGLEKSEKEFIEIANTVMSKISFKRKTIVEMYSKFFRAIRFAGTNQDAANFVRDMLLQNVEYRNKNPLPMNDVLEHMLKSNQLTFNDIWAHSSVMFIAGLDNLLSTIKYCIFELARNEKCQDMARDCVREAIAKHGEIRYESLNDMQYLEQCINGEHFKVFE